MSVWYPQIWCLNLYSNEMQQNKNLIDLHNLKSYHCKFEECIDFINKYTVMRQIIT